MPHLQSHPASFKSGAKVRKGLNVLLHGWLEKSDVAPQFTSRATTRIADDGIHKVRQMPWPSLETASRVAQAANLFFIAGLVVCILSAILIAWMASVKEAHWASARKEAEERATELKRSNLRLQADVDTARTNFANASARALEAQLALERFRSPRAIEQADKSRLASALSLFSGTKAAIYVLAEGTEPSGLGASIQELLREAHWQSFTWTWSGAGITTGVLVSCKAGSDQHINDICGALVAAFNSAHIESKILVWPGDWEHFGGFLNGPNQASPIEAPIRIIIGSKPQ